LLVLSKKPSALTLWDDQRNDPSGRSPDIIAQAAYDAHQAGTWLKPACELAGIDVWSLQRRKAGDGLLAEPAAGLITVVRFRKYAGFWCILKGEKGSR